MVPTDMIIIIIKKYKNTILCYWFALLKDVCSKNLLMFELGNNKAKMLQRGVQKHLKVCSAVKIHI